MSWTVESFRLLSRGLSTSEKANTVMMDPASHPHRDARPVISVVVPCANEGVLLEEAVSSILAQEVEVPFEAVVVLDREPDEETSEVLAEISTDDRVRVLRNDRTPGLPGARNSGIAHSKGTWIGFLDADDVLSPGSLQRRWAVAESDPDVRFVATDFTERTVEGEERPWVSRFSENERVRSAVRRIADAAGSHPYVRFRRPAGVLADAQLVWICTVMADRRLLREIDGFDESLERAEDTNFLLRLAANADLYFIPESLAVYRRRIGSMTLSGEPTQLKSRHAIAKLLDDEDFRPYRRALRRRLARMNERLVWHYRNSGRPKEAIAPALELVRVAPWQWKSWRTLLGTLLDRG